MPEHRVPLGALRRGGYRILEQEMSVGDVLLAYSDGVLEAQSAAGDFFGDLRLVEVLKGCPSDPEALIVEVLRALDDFTRGHTAYDDLTLLAVSRTECAGGG